MANTHTMLLHVLVLLLLYTAESGMLHCHSAEQRRKSVLAKRRTKLTKISKTDHADAVMVDVTVAQGTLTTGAVTAVLIALLSQSTSWKLSLA